jgi:hypothetical protein
MKRLINFFPTAMMAFALAGCTDDAAQKDPVHLDFKISDNHVGTDLPSGTTLLVSMETSTGEPVYDLAEISFSRSEDGFSTTALDLKPGEYTVTEFMLVDQDRKILYTTPRGTTKLSGGISSPALNFRVSANAQTGIHAEMLNVENYTPADLGLSSFSLKNSIQVAVVNEEDNVKTFATAAILKDQDTVAYLNLFENKGRISFDGDPDEIYTLIISQAGSAPYIKQGKMNELVAQYSNRPLKVSLKTAFTMVADVAATDITQPFYFYIGGTEGEISVNWGDGTIETYSLDTEYEFEVAHSYTIPQDYPIVITGDLKNIRYFYSFYGGSVFREISFKNLTNLIEIRYGLTNCPKVIDLSHNTKLQFAMLPHLADMETLILPRSHEISFIEIDGINQLNTEDIDRFVDNIYNNTVKKNITNGIIGMRGYWAQEEGDFTMVGPPSPAAMTKLLYLQNNYGWSVSPSEALIETLANNRFYGKHKKKI